MKDAGPQNPRSSARPTFSGLHPIIEDDGSSQHRFHPPPMSRNPHRQPIHPRRPLAAPMTRRTTMQHPQPDRVSSSSRVYSNQPRVASGRNSMRPIDYQPLHERMDGPIIRRDVQHGYGPLPHRMTAPEYQDLGDDENYETDGYRSDQVDGYPEYGFPQGNSEWSA
jgi:hypothetical protein